MPTNLALDDDLVNEAKKLGGHKTKREAVNKALEEYVRLRRRVRMIESFGTIDFDPNYDYKEERRKSMKRIPRG